MQWVEGRAVEWGVGISSVGAAEKVFECNPMFYFFLLASSLFSPEYRMCGCGCSVLGGWVW